jgi:DsbC/DsbD-like thiol-disulfide interchange protein
MPMTLIRMQVLFLALTWLGSTLTTARAEDSASAWATGSKSAARLIAAPADAQSAYRAGIEIKLAPNTITYWRSPGESGVPPVFEFSHSSNLRSVDVSFPAPKRINEDGSDIYGYDTDVVLPIRVEPQERGKPVDLVLNLDYAACEKICLPVRAKLELSLPAKDAGSAATLAAAEAAVPRRLSQTEIARDVIIAPVPGADKPTWRLIWGGGPAQDLFAEAPDLFFIETKRAGEGFLVAVADHPKDMAVPDQPVRFTITGPEPVDFALHLDGRAATP